MKPRYSTEAMTKKLGKEGRVDPEKLRELTKQAKKEKKTIFQLLIEKDIMKEEEVMGFLSQELHIPMLNLSAYKIPSGLIKSIPKKLVDRYQILPIGQIGQTLTVVSSNPFDLMLHDDLKEITRCKVCLALATPKAISSAMENYYGESSNLEAILEGIDDDEQLEFVQERGKKGEGQPPGGDQAKADDAPVIRMVNLILSEGIKERASDIHFEPYEKSFRVRYRVDGALKESYSYSRDLYPSLVARVKIMSQLDITEKRLPQDGRFRVRIRGQEIDFRVSLLPIYHGEKVVLRVLDRSGMKSGLDNLGFSEKPTKVFADAIKRPYGMILVTGPTGSGKSTTLYTILNTLNTPDRNIMTIEDPVEYQVEGITQTQVQSNIGMTFATGLRALLRQSPDIVLVGEMRDTETADIGVKAALTGHLVFSTLHTNSAAGAVTRLIDMGVEPFLIASSVICVAAQRLVKKICQFCKVPYELSDEDLRRVGLKRSDVKDCKPMKGKGCAKCNTTGYFGRCGVIEVMKVDNNIHDLIIQRQSSDMIHDVAVKAGMETLFENTFGLFSKGITSLDEVLRVTQQE